MKKLMSVLLTIFIVAIIIAGISMMGLAGKDYVETKTVEKQSTEKAKELLSKEPIKREEFKPDFGEATGMLVIDKIDADLPIVEGTHEDDLKKGVGHYEGTSYPLDDDQILLSGHRDTVFKRMGELEIGDIMTIRMPYGDFEYEIVETKIVDADDRSIIVPHDEETLTVSTCYPFGYIGDAPDRYIIDAKPVFKYEEDED